MPRIDPSTLPVRSGSIYPEPYSGMVAGRSSLRLGDAGGLTQFGANLVTLEPGAISSLRHWHENEDEFVMITDGELTLIEDDGESVMRRGDCAAFPAGAANGHNFVNRTDLPGTFLVIGTRAAAEVAHYSDVDLTVRIDANGPVFSRRDGTPYPPKEGAK